MHRADVSEIVSTCDAGREENSFSVCLRQSWRAAETYTRLWISSMEDSAIKETFQKNLKNGEEYDALFASALMQGKG